MALVYEWVQFLAIFGDTYGMSVCAIYTFFEHTGMVISASIFPTTIFLRITYN